ncbi:MAG: hypothetical protein ACYC8T_11615 [Myxococcaceae bacterium]
MTALALLLACALGAEPEELPPPLVEAAAPVDAGAPAEAVEGPPLLQAPDAGSPGGYLELAPAAGGGTAGPEMVSAPPLMEAPDSPLMPVTGEQERVVPSQDFVKGELSVFLGSDRVVTKNNRIGVSAGVDRVGSIFYLLLEPQVDLRFLNRKLAIGLGVPLRFELADLANATDYASATRNQWNLRQDYKELADYARLLKYVTYGRKEDHLYINIGQRYASSIGHGALVRRYAPNIDVDLTRVSAQLDAYGGYAGVELLTNDVVRWNVLSGLAFVKPLAFVDTLVTRSLSVGVSAAADLRAPTSLVYAGDGSRVLDTDGVHLAANYGTVLLYGVDAEVKVLKTANADIKPYVDYSMLQGGDSGFTVGVLGRFNAGTKTVHAFRGVVELRSLGSRYVPSYFDTFYEVERYGTRAVVQTSGHAAYDTKITDVMSGRRPQRLGYYLEGSWGIRGGIGFTLAAEGTGDTAEKNLVAHLEVPAVDFLQFFGSYYKRGFTDVGELARIDQKTIVFAGARLKLLPILFVNARAFKTFQMNTDVKRLENPETFKSFGGLYNSSFGFTLDIELGYEFAVASEAAPVRETPAAAEASAGPG